ncbi:MAG: GAF domain-containing sensor histidine kinase [Cyanobacterium sp. T60_A2020_053]|nr:GAF domain-containing sensor histidine kinase [Cyanobacterium sp. T60_A2020_053]
MKSAPLPDNEQQRIEALLRYDILDTDFEEVYDELTQLASSICGTPITLISLIDTHRQWFKSKVGLQPRETNRDIAFCSHAILQSEVFIIEDATADERFADNPLVTGSPYIRFYAGAPLITPDGFSLGTLCAIDTVPRQFSADQIKALKILARQVSAQLELRLSFSKLQNYARQLRQVNASKDKFFSIIAHDLKAPFNSMLGFADILQSNAENLDITQIKDLSSDIYNTGKSTYRLLENLLQWSMLEIGSLPWKPTRLNLNEVVDDILLMLSGVARTKSISLINKIIPAQTIYGDTKMLQSVLQNLINNALKFTPEEGQVTVSSQVEHNLIRVIVSDTGVGMTQQQVNKLFNIEHCISRDGTQGEKGTGLGLLLCQEFVAKNGGTMKVESHIGKGSQVSFTIPKI